MAVYYTNGGAYPEGLGLDVLNAIENNTLAQLKVFKRKINVAIHHPLISLKWVYFRN